tara:strand:- start:6360 stop:6737 length:378 start_codon:yes stop_codon:yes gene_type:complete
MPRSLKLFIGAVTALPIVLFGYLFVRFVSVFIGLVDNGGSVQPDRLRDTFHELMGIQLTTLGVIVALLGFYLWHLLVVRARRQSDANLVVWVLAFLFVPIVAMPVYWFANIWRETGDRPGRSQLA